MASSKTITALDLGTESFKLLVAQKDPKKGKIKVIVQIERPSAGMMKGRVKNSEEVAGALKTLIGEAEKLAGFKIKSAFININGSYVSSLVSHGSVAVSRADGMISQEDVDRVIEISKNAKIPQNREIIDIFPLEFIIDGEKGIKDPIGMKGIKLEVRSLIVVAFTPFLQKLQQAVTEAGLDIENILVSPLLSAKSVLSKEQKELGTAVLDIGSETSGLAVFEEGDLIDLAIFAVGSNDITKDIAKAFQCDFHLADKIKKEYAFQPKFERKKGRIKVSGEGEVVSFTPKQLNEVVELRISDSFDDTNKELKRISRQGLLPGGIVITGGAAHLPKIIPLAKKYLKLPVKIGVPRKFPGFRNDPEWSVAAGLILEGFEDKGSFSFSFGRIGEKLKRFFRIFIP